MDNLQVIKHLKFSAIVVPPLYEESFRRAILTFLHQRVYDPITEDIVHLSDLPDNIDEDLDFLGPYPYLAIFSYEIYSKMLFLFLSLWKCKGKNVIYLFLDLTTHRYLKI